MLLNTAFADMGDIRPRVDPKATDFLDSSYVILQVCFRSVIVINCLNVFVTSALVLNVTWWRSERGRDLREIRSEERRVGKECRL